MFEGYTVYKQWHKKQGRWYALFYHPKTGHRMSMSWARYVMSVHMGRLLDKVTETVDHINGDKTDDRLDNLQLMVNVDNIRKSATKGRNIIILICPICEVEFSRERRHTHLVKGGTDTYCSRKCSYKGVSNKLTGKPKSKWWE